MSSVYTPVDHPPRKCEICGQMFKPKNKRRSWCYAGECERTRKRNKMRAYVASAEERTGRSFWAQVKRTRTTYEIECKHCGKTAVVTRKEAKYCSSTCGVRAVKGKGSAIEVYAGPPCEPRNTEPPTTLLPRTWKFTAGYCRICGDGFVSHWGHITCSDECAEKHKRDQKRAHRDRRRALQKNAYRADVSRSKIHERDGYRCHLCKKRVDMTKQVPHPKAPTLDHIIPLANGGTHEPSNVATACFYCNCIKSNTGYTGQLLLFG